VKAFPLFCWKISPDSVTIRRHTSSNSAMRFPLPSGVAIVNTSLEVNTVVLSSADDANLLVTKVSLSADFH
jgi:hypothetical protein